MKRLLLVGGLVGAAVVVVLLVWPPHAAVPVEAAPTATATPVVAAPPAPAAKAEPATAAVAPAPTTPPPAPSGTNVVAPPTAAASAANTTALPAKVAPLTKQEKLDGLAPAVPDLEQRVARLRKEADEDERQGHADLAKLKRVAADRNERRLGEIRASLAEGKLPPGYVNSSSTDKSKE